MTEAVDTAGRVVMIMAAMLFSGLIMGQRHVGQISVFDLLTGIAIGSVAGAGIVDPRISWIDALTGTIGLAALHYGVTWLEMK